MTLWPDFGGDGAYGIPYVSVPFSQPLVPVSFDGADESDPGPYPIPPDAPVEGGGDRHVLTLRQGDCKLFELYAAAREGSGWHAYSGAVWDLKSNAAAPRGLDLGRRRRAADPARARAPRRGRRRRHPPRAAHHGPGDAEGVHPPGDALGVEQHRHRPAADGPARAAEGGYDISGLRGQAHAIAQALKTYGAIVADNAGSPRVYVGGVVDRGWDDEALNGIKSIPASALEAVQTGPVVRP